MDKLIGKSIKYVYRYMHTYGYITAGDYEDGENYIVYFSKTSCGVTIKSVIIVFNSKMKVIEVKKW